MEPSVNVRNNGQASKKINKVDEYAGRKIGNEARIEIVCHQRSALMLDAMSSEEAYETLIVGKRPAPDRESPPRDRCFKKLHRDRNGRIALPIEMLFACTRNAGRKVKVGKSNISTAKTTELPSFLVFEDEYLTLFNPETGEQLTDEDWKHDVRRGMMKAGGKETAVCIIRPRFDQWGFKVNISVDMTGLDGLTEKHIYQLFEIAGRRIGLGAFNPFHNGPFGRFKIVEFNVLE